MPIELSLEEVIEGVLLIGILVIVFVGCGRTLGVIKANCDLDAVEKYNEFVKLFEECGEDAAKCGFFNHGDLLDGHEIVIESVGKSTSIDLECDDKLGKSKIVKLGLCASEDGGYLGNLEDFRVEKNMFSIFSKDGRIELKRIREGEVCINRIGREGTPTTELGEWA